MKDAPYLGQNCVSPYSRSEWLLSCLWSVVQATVFRWSPRFWHRWRVELLRLFGASIPRPATVVIFPTAIVQFPWKLTLGPHAMVGPRVRLYNLGPIELKRGANISQGCHLCSGSHDYTRWSMPLTTAPITISENAWLGADVFVLPGVTVGELAVVGARSVITHDLPPKTICAGHPCLPIKPRPDPT